MEPELDEYGNPIISEAETLANVDDNPASGSPEINPTGSDRIFFLP